MTKTNICQCEFQSASITAPWTLLGVRESNHAHSLHLSVSMNWVTITSMKPKSLSNLARNLIHRANTLQPNSMTQIHPQSTKVEKQPAASSGNTTQSVWSKGSLPKTAPCVLKREFQFLNNPDPTHNFLSTLTMKSTVLVDTRPVFHMHAKQTTPSTDDKRHTPTHKDAEDFDRCNVCLADVQPEAL